MVNRFDEYALNIVELFDRLKTGPEELIEEGVGKRLAIYGLSLVIVMLLIAALITGVFLRENIDAYVIYIVVIIFAILGFAKVYHVKRAVEEAHAGVKKDW